MRNENAEIWSGRSLGVVHLPEPIVVAVLRRRAEWSNVENKGQ